MNNYEIIKQMTVEEMSILFQDIAKQLVSEIEEKRNIDLKAKPNYVWEIKQWLLQEV
jgi:hypothetical protein